MCFVFYFFRNFVFFYMGVFSWINLIVVFNYVIFQIVSGDVMVSIQVLVQFEKVVRNKNYKEVSKYIDQFLNVVFFQFNMILIIYIFNVEFGQQLEVIVLRFINCLMDIMLGVFFSVLFVCVVLCSFLKQVMQVLIMVLLDDCLVVLEEGLQILRVINILMVKVIEMFDQIYVLG